MRYDVSHIEMSRTICTFGTPFGRYRFLRMPMGIKEASEVFQEYFSEIFNIPGVEVYVDDILIYAKNKTEHDKILEQVFQIAKENNIKFNLSKCRFGLNEIKYLGHKFSAAGITIDEEKIDAIKNMPSPTRKKDIERFLGLIT
ncbi:Retrovirus-related Pol polyprotein from transposon 17.6-like Protein [Tribolium castaneum]|uniref:Retrovirus-related Pol polyprotein from transposon 17.6-like Protein n=1 Tax=Tribolium castaneum TaxID=7070 RepID=D2CG40_TRICA|nr:Retrovirus-related Pol polyprotein from transposon 17.6-like Protein [Tribolium castaneum]